MMPFGPTARRPGHPCPHWQLVNQGSMSETECFPNSVFITQGTASQIWGNEMAPRLVARMIEVDSEPEAHFPARTIPLERKPVARQSFGSG
jgi:hypothetical protein